jgi:hypothetical protein
MPDPGLPQTLTPWLVLGTTTLAFLGALWTAWAKAVRPTIQRAIWTSVEGSVTATVAAATKALLDRELGPNGDDHRLPESERGKPLRSLVIASRVDSAATRTRLDDHDQRYVEVNAAQTRLLYEMERHMEHHGPWEAAYDLDRTTRGLPPVEETKSA